MSSSADKQEVAFLYTEVPRFFGGLKIRWRNRLAWFKPVMTLEARRVDQYAA